MSASAKLSAVALLAVFVLAWGLVATTPSVQRPVPTAQSGEFDPEPTPAPAPAPVPVPEPAAAAKPQPAPTPQAPKAPEAPAIDDPERGNAAEEDDPNAAAEAARDRDTARNAEGYDAARDRFGTEARDEAWASEQERALSKLVNEASPGELLEGIACKTSMCEVRVRFNAVIAAGSVERLGPLMQAMGPERVVRNEGAADQRTMVIYTPRDGHWPDAPTEHPAGVAP